MEFLRAPSEGVEFQKREIGISHVSAGESNLDLHSRDELYIEPHRPDVAV